MKSELANNLINDQKSSLDNWFNYFLSDDSNYIPTWAKFWSFQGMVRLGKFDKEKGIFNKRTKNTTTIFADLNREALALSIDFLRKALNRKNIDDKELEKIVKSGSFKKIYEYILNTVFNNNKDIIKKDDGIWIKYDIGSDYLPLVESLKGYNTGWCTAGEETAKTQLQNGDFYVYYTLDNNKEYKVPRIAIRMEDNSIGEIRGIADEQNIEPNMEKVVEEKIKGFPDKDKYYKKVNDMEFLTYIYEKNKNHVELSKEDLRFLYEIDNEIEGFGYLKDPRISEIIKTRNIKNDLAHLFDCKENQIALSKSELKENSVCLRGDLNYRILKECENLILPQIIIGDLFLPNLKDVKGIKIPIKIIGSLYLNSITSAEDLKLPIRIGGSLFLNGLKDAKGLKLPEKIVGGLDLENLINIEGLEFPKYVGDCLWLDKLQSAVDLKLPEQVGGSLSLDSLQIFKGLKLPNRVGGDLRLSSLTSIEGLKLPSYIGGKVYLQGLQTLGGLENPNNLDLVLPKELLLTLKGSKIK